MIATALVILPVFGLILAGALYRRFGIFGPETGTELNRFVVVLALPALLFHITATADWSKLWQPGFVTAFFGASLIVFVSVLVWRRWDGRHLSDAAIDALNAAYANTGYVGLPLCQLVFGPGSLTLATTATILTVCALFAVALVVVELGLETEARLHRLVPRVAASLLRNPLLVAPVLGAAWAALGVPLPPSVDAGLTLLGSAASPCALVALGLFLAEPRACAPGAMGTALALTLLKLVVHPALAAVLAYWIFALPPRMAAILVVLSALPTGTGSFMVAGFYRREAQVTSRTILVTTIASVASLAFWIWLVGGPIV